MAFVAIGGKKLPSGFKLLNIGDALAYLLFIYLRVSSIFFEHFRNDILDGRAGIVKRDDIVSKLVHTVNRAAENIEDYVKAV